MTRPRRIAVYDLTDFFTSAVFRELDEPVECSVVQTERDLYRTAAETAPHVVLLDVTSFGQRAPAVVSRLKQEAPHAAICVISDLPDPRLAGQLLSLGLGCLLPRSRLDIAGYVLALQAALNGTGTVAVGAELLLEAFQRGHITAATRIPDTMSDTEESLRSILRQLVCGETQPATAAQLHVKARTVQRRLERAKTRARARSLLELAIFAERLGWFDDLELPPRPS